MIGTMMVVSGLWNKPGVYTTDEFDPDPYMEALNKWGLPWKVVENPVLVREKKLGISFSGSPFSSNIG